MNNDAFLIKCIGIAGKLQAVILCNLIAAVLNSLAVFCKVVIVNVAGLVNNLLEACKLCNHAVVHPIGVRSNTVNAIQHSLEYAFFIEYITCGGIVLRNCGNAGSCVSGFGVQIVGIAVNDCPTGLLRLLVLVILLAVVVRQPAVYDLPLSVQGHIIVQRADCAAVRIGCAGAVGLGIPADELIVGASKCICTQLSINAVFKGLCLHGSLAAVGIEGHGMEDALSLGILRGVGRILGNYGDFGIPAVEGVTIMIVHCLVGAALEGRHGALLANLGSFNTVYDPGDGRAGLGDRFALFQQLVADRAVGVASVAILDEGCFLRIPGFLGVAICRYNLLCNQHFVADGAMLALGLAGLGAGGRHGRINHFGMALCRDYRLGNQHFVANGAVLALGLTGLGAGGIDSCIHNLSVAACRNLFQSGNGCAANRALGTSSMSCFGAGCGLLSHVNRSMSSRVDCFGLGCIANCAGVGLDTGILTGGSGRGHALIPAVALGRDHFRRFDNRSADRAADAIRQARFGAGRRLARNSFFLVAGRGNHFLRNKDFVADRAVRTLGLAGRGAGCRNSLVNDFHMTGGGNHFLFNKNFVANRAMLAFRQARLGAGCLLARNAFLSVSLGRNGAALDFIAADHADCITGVAVLGTGGILLVDHLGERMVVLPLCVEGGVLRQINIRTIRIGVTSTIGRRIPVQEIVAFTGERVCVQCGIRLCIYGLWGHRAFDRVFRTSVGFKGNRQLHRRFAAPNAIDIVDNIVSACGRSFSIRAVSVMQLGSGDGDGHRLIAICIILIGCGFRTGCALLNVLAGAVAGADIRTALGGVDGANSRYAAVYINLSVFKVCICAVVHLARCICHGLKLAGAPDKVIAVPLIAVIEIDVLSVCNRQASALGNIDLNARQQSCILIDGHIAGLNIDGNVVGDRQYVACRVDTHACKL